MSSLFLPYALKDRRFLISGATGGAGSRTAIEISRLGGKCTLVARDGNKAEKVLRELMGSGHGMILYDKDGAADCWQRAPYDGWFDGAGIECIKPLSQSFEMEQVFHANVGNVMATLAAVGSRAKPLLTDGGSIVLMSSVAAVRGTSGMSLYSASKGAIEALTKSAAVELAARRIRVNCLRCGGFASPMHTRLTQRMTVDQIDAYSAKHLLGFGRPDDIANAAVFLLSDASRWITGSALVCDGGFSAR